ncbi:MAG: lamin tail domain-containing protein [Saprospiraceae bacterium]|nr:lamin tail domain-containing protein [Saprospiraceae bacterium]
MKSFIWLILFTMVFLTPLYSQIIDDFSDDLTDNPTWLGDTADFIVNAQGKLQLNASDAGTSYLYFQDSIVAAHVWSFHIELDFDPSSNNRVRVYLALNHTNPFLADGYCLELGEDGSNDVWSLFRLNEGSTTLLTRGQTSFPSQPSMSVRCSLDLDGRWFIETVDDLTSETNTQIEFSGAPPNPSSPKYFGLHCNYTQTRSRGFFFDNISSGPSGTTPSLTIESITVNDEHEIEVNFSHKVEQLVAEDPLIYDIEPVLGNPLKSRLMQNGQAVTLVFQTAIVPNLEYSLSVFGILDVFNVESDLSADFRWDPNISIQPLQIVINEIFADPTPSIGLPGFEYLELHYPAGDGSAVDLKDLTLLNGSSEVALPAFVMRAGDYVIVADHVNLEVFQSFGQTVGAANFPALHNNGDDLRLIDGDLRIIHEVVYDRSWYGDKDKDDGGYSLEMINPFDACALSENWRASNHLGGGTPGSQNSVYADSEITTFAIISVVPSPDKIKVLFNKQLASMPTNRNASISGGNVQITDIVSPSSRQMDISIFPPLLPGTGYELRIDSIFDCQGAIPNIDTFEVTLPENANPGDIIINEVLFNPKVGSTDYLELVNVSSKRILLSNLFVGNLAGREDIRSIDCERLISPGEHIVLTDDPDDVQLHYVVPRPDWLIKQELPTLSDDSGNITLYRTRGSEVLLIDAFDYSSSFHAPLLRDQNGVSLERISIGEMTQTPSNWTSASSRSGFGTPTGPNSQSRSGPDLADFVVLDPKIFSPDGDGFDDFLRIHYTLPGPSYLGNLRVFDAAGRMIIQLANNQSLGQRGTIKWEGETDGGNKALVGIYVLSLEVFTPEGHRMRWEDTCVLAGKL